MMHRKRKSERSAPKCGGARSSARKVVFTFAQLGRLGRVVRVPQLGGDVELEVAVVLHGGVSQSDAHGAALLERLLLQQRLQRRVHRLQNVLQQHRLAKLDGHVLRLLHFADPLVRRVGRVDAQRPPPRVVQHDRVLRRELVLRQPLDVPVANLDGVAHEGGKVELFAVRHLPLLVDGHPLVHRLVAVGGVERPQVRDGPRRHQHVARDLRELLLEVRKRAGGVRITSHLGRARRGG
eukprot:1195902-Prorocentrum_minimum.AAC.2